MIESDVPVPDLVKRLNELGLMLSVTTMANGRLRLNEWKTARYFANETLIKELWSELVLNRPGRYLEIARYLASSPPLAPEP